MLTLVTVSHGTSDASGRAAVDALAAAIADAGWAGVTVHAYVDVQEPSLETVLADLPRDAQVVVLPLFLSRGFHVNVDLVRAAEGSARDVVVARPLGPDARLAALVADRLRAGGLEEDDRVVLAAAGSSDADGVADVRRTVRLLEAALGRPVAVGFLSAAEPRLADAIAAERTSGTGRVVAADYLLAPGYFHDLVSASDADTVSPPLLTTAEAPHPLLIDCARDRLDEAMATSRRARARAA